MTYNKINTRQVCSALHLLCKPLNFQKSLSGGIRVSKVYHVKQKRVLKTEYSLVGALEGTRTPGLLVRSQSLYPAELQAHSTRHYIITTLAICQGVMQNIFRKVFITKQNNQPLPERVGDLFKSICLHRDFQSLCFHQR